MIHISHRWHKKIICKAIFFFIVFFLFLTGAVSAAMQDSDNGNTEKETPPGTDQIFQEIYPSLVKSVRFDGPITFCNVRIPIEDQDVRERLEKEMLLALWDRAQVILWIKRSSKYFPHMEKILKENDMPFDLKYVPVIESALRPHAESYRDAVGFWQFIASTGKRNGLRINSMVDERRNLFKSTVAGCRYLKKLEAKFGSYFLALAAYNMGENALDKEIKAQQTKDFFSLYLPLETQRYILKLAAAKLIIENPGNYGFHFENSDLYPVFSYDRINFNTDVQIPIVLIAQAADISFKTIKDYNPHLRGYYLEKGNVSILVPEGKSKGFESCFTAVYKNWQKKHQTRFHVVQKGESLGLIAGKYGIPMGSLLRANNLSLKSTIHPGDRLIIEK